MILWQNYLQQALNTRLDLVELLSDFPHLMMLSFRLSRIEGEDQWYFLLREQLLRELFLADLKNRF